MKKEVPSFEKRLVTDITMKAQPSQIQYYPDVNNQYGQVIRRQLSYLVCRIGYSLPFKNIF